MQPTKLNLPNQTYLTKPTKPKLPDQTYQTKPTKQNPPNATFQIDKITKIKFISWIGKSKEY